MSRTEAVAIDRQAAEGLRQLTPTPQPATYLAGATGAFGALSLVVGALTDQMTSGAGVGAGSFAVAGLCAAAGHRARQRQMIADHLTEVLTPLLGTRKASRKAVKLSSWGGGFVGAPERIRIHHAAHLVIDPAWKAKVCEATTQILGRAYTVDSHTPRSHRLVLAPAQIEQQEPQDPEVARATSVVADLFGDSAKADVQAQEGVLTQIRVKHEQGNAMAIANRRNRAQRILATRLPGDWVAAWDLQADEVVFSLRPEMPRLVYPPQEHSPTAVDHSAYMDFAVPLGVDESGHTIQWCPRKQAHMLVIGGSGSGKTVVQHNVVQRLTQAGWRTWIVDGKRIEFIGFRDWPNIELIGARVEHQVRMVVAAHELMEERYAKIESGQATLADFEPLALVIDEVTTFLKRVDRWWKQVKPKGAPVKAPVLELLADMARLARSAKIHLVFGLQRPDVEFIGGEMRDNFGARVSMGRLSPQGAMMLWDSPSIGTTTPRDVKGRGVGIGTEGSPVPVQFYYAPNPDTAGPDYDRAATEAVRPRQLLYPRQLIEILEPREDLDGEEVPLGYEDFMDAKIYQAPDQPRVGGEPGSSAIGTSQALQSLLAVTASPLLLEASDSRSPQVEEQVVAQPRDPEPPRGSASKEGTEEDFEGYGPAIQADPSELVEGDLILIDAESEQYGVVQDPPEPEEDGTYYLDFLDWESGDLQGVCLDATATVSVRRPSLDPTI